MRSALVTLALCLSSLPPAAQAQSSRFSGLSVTRFHYESAPFIAVTYRRTVLGNRGGGADIAVGVVPSALPARVLFTQVDLGFAKAVTTGPARLLVRVGTSNFVALAQSLEVYPGAQLGAGALIRIEDASWARLEVSRHYYVQGDESLAMWSLGIGFAVQSPP
jgi:hypothetical protein